MARTRVGYTSGAKDLPTYRSLGDHTESIEIAYDPKIIGYGALLDVFLQAHTPTHPPFSRQYRSAIFVHDDAQREIAEGRLTAYAKAHGGEVYTAVEDAPTFWPAEDYHQKYRLRGDAELMALFGEMYSSEADFLASTAAARANGYLAGYGDGKDLSKLGLPSAAVARLRERVQ